jgi:hypothetical protein
MTPKPKKIPLRNKSWSGWWIFREVLQWLSDRDIARQSKGRGLVWENTRVIQAKNRNEAYSKAVRLGSSGHPARTNKGEWRFLGISSLLPIYEDLEDGSEILWEDRGVLTIAKAKRLVIPKLKLSVFDDTKKGA